eukprot:5255297-Prymnesium_polylepis.1
MGPSTWAGLSGYCLIVIVIQRGAPAKARPRDRTAGRHGRELRRGGRLAERSPGTPDRRRRGARRAATSAPCSTRGSDAALG